MRQHPSENYFKLKSIEISFAYNVILHCQIVLQFCTEHGSMAAVLCGKFLNDLTTGMDVMDGGDFAWFQFEIIFWGIFCSATAPWLEFVVCGTRHNQQNYCTEVHYSSRSMYFISQATPLFVHRRIQANNKEVIKDVYYWSFVLGIRRTKDQYCESVHMSWCLHDVFMMSSWILKVSGELAIFISMYNERNNNLNKPNLKAIAREI